MNWEEGTNLPYEEFPIICLDTILLREVKFNSSPLECQMDLVKWIPLAKNKVCTERNSNFTMEKPSRHYFNQVINVNIMSDKSG